MSGEAKAGKEHLATLDLLRLVAALSVLAFHYLFRSSVSGEMATAYPEVAPVAIYGYLGVNLFFLISGFVIAWSAEGRSWETFGLARFIRLYPGHVVCMTLTFLVMLVLAPAAFPVSGAQYLANLTMFAPALGQPFMDGVYWSIVLELVFYGWVTLALLTGGFQRLKLELVMVWLAVSALNEFVIGSGALRMIFITEFGPYFAGGILVHHMMSRGISQGALMLLIAAFLMSCNTLTVTQGWMQAHYGTSVPLPGLIVANVVMHGLLIAAVVFRARLKPSTLTLALGGLTYPLYLLHQHIGYVGIDAAAPMLGKWSAAAMITVAIIVISWAIWRFIEAPSQRRLRAVLVPKATWLIGRIRRRVHLPTGNVVR